jgi:hypothetical protein
VGAVGTVVVRRTSFVFLPPSPKGLRQDVEREVAQLLEPTETPVLYLFLELRLWVVVVGLSRLSPTSSLTWQDV